MGLYVARRAAAIIPVLLGVTAVVFLLTELVPGDPALLMLGENASPDLVATVRRQMGLDRPILSRYAVWLSGVVRGDFGTSLIDSRPVFPDVMRRFPKTLLLLAASLMVSLAIAIPVGVVSGVRRESWFDNASRVLALLGLAMPAFWKSLLLILLFAYLWPVLPATGSETLLHVILPAFALGTGMAAIVMRLVRSSLLEVLRQDYVRTAMSKGLGLRSVVFRHALRNAMLPVVTIIGLQVGYLLGGSVVIETIFDWPGIGKYTYLRMLQRDYPTIMANLLIFTLLFSLINLVTDICYAFLDPRIRYE
ncbi:MAG: ABC transporter permease [Armatimonadota bacterium]